MNTLNECNFSNTCGFDFILFTTSISLFLARDLNGDEQNLLGNFFLLLGQNLITTSTYCGYIEKTYNDKKNY